MKLTAEEVRALREQKRWTQRELAERIGVTTRTIMRWEKTGSSYLGGRELRRLERAA